MSLCADVFYSELLKLYNILRLVNANFSY